MTGFHHIHHCAHSSAPLPAIMNPNSIYSGWYFIIICLAAFMDAGLSPVLFSLEKKK